MWREPTQQCRVGRWALCLCLTRNLPLPTQVLSTRSVCRAALMAAAAPAVILPAPNTLDTEAGVHLHLQAKVKAKDSLPDRHPSRRREPRVDDTWQRARDIEGNGMLINAHLDPTRKVVTCTAITTPPPHYIVRVDLSGEDAVFSCNCVFFTKECYSEMETYYIDFPDVDPSAVEKVSNISHAVPLSAACSCTGPSFSTASTYMQPLCGVCTSCNSCRR